MDSVYLLYHSSTKPRGWIAASELKLFLLELTLDSYGLTGKNYSMNKRSQLVLITRHCKSWERRKRLYFKSHSLSPDFFLQNYEAIGWFKGSQPQKSQCAWIIHKQHNTCHYSCHLFSKCFTLGTGLNSSPVVSHFILIVTLWRREVCSFIHLSFISWIAGGEGGVNHTSQYVVHCHHWSAQGPFLW